MCAWEREALVNPGSSRTTSIERRFQTELLNTIGTFSRLKHLAIFGTLAKRTELECRFANHSFHVAQNPSWISTDYRMGTCSYQEDVEPSPEDFLKYEEFFISVNLSNGIFPSRPKVGIEVSLVTTVGFYRPDG